MYEGKLTEKECLEALRTTENEKSPGTDGIPADFHEVFWKDITKYYTKAMNCAYK